MTANTAASNQLFPLAAPTAVQLGRNLRHAGRDGLPAGKRPDAL
jgi:hypothetical protein